MRAWAVCCLLSCLASSALAVHHPLHKHRHEKGKRTEVLVVEEDTIVEDIDVTIFLPGPPPEDWKNEHADKEYPLATYTLLDGSVTVIPGPKPTRSDFGRDAGKGKVYTPPSNPKSTGVKNGAGEVLSSHPIATSSVVGNPGSDSGSGFLSGVASSGSATISAGSSASLKKNSNHGLAASLMVNYTTTASPAANSPTMTTTPSSFVVPANESPASTAASSAVAPSHSGAYPFSALVAFGDNLSDNGNGSYAHNVAANTPTDVVDGNKIYGAGTWTNGPIAVSYLTDLLGVPMNQNFAFGHAWGGSHFGATIDDTMQQSNFSASLEDGPWFNNGQFSEPCWGAPSAKVQINDYIQSGVNKDALHFLWIGANDMDAAYKGTLGIDTPTLNDEFAGNISTKIPDLASTLLTAGAPYVLVANLYPKQLAPLWPGFLGINTTSQWDALGAVISSANIALEAALKALPNADKVIYYDAFTFMSNLYAEPGSEFPNIKDTNGFPSFCDGDKAETEYVLSINGTVVDGVEITDNWDYCVTLKHQDEWYWMQYLDPTSHVHQLVAQDMEATVKKFPFPL
ncbi:MAG: hypothetical protein ASARMPRED_008989 [Alectoria sarmentosa]|nr:MAG: hypothetical protein ASARMPRED_008989 [Alectoria sarmentosa]